MKILSLDTCRNVVLDLTFLPSFPTNFMYPHANGSVSQLADSRPGCHFFKFDFFTKVPVESSEVHTMKIRSSCFALFCLALVWSQISLAQTEPEPVSSDEITRALERPATRGIRVRTKSKVDLNIPFEINSSDLKPEAEEQLMQLKDALQKDELSGFRFEVVGHTDASGSARYNRKLSEARAESVRRFLVGHGVDPRRIDVVGRGEDDLLYPDRPLHGANRRVEIRNLGE